MSSESGQPLATRYSALICDLDGVVYRGPEPVPGAAETLNKLTSAGVGVVFATNNASRPPAEVAAHLRELGVEGSSWSVAGSSQAAAAYLAQRHKPGARVYAVGGPGVPEALTEAGLTPVRIDDLGEGPVEAMVQGLGVDVTWRELAELSFLAQHGVPWVVTNLDITLPSARGPAPGNGSMVAVVQTATTARPHVTGKPAAALYHLARERMQSSIEQTLGCGDRLDTDIVGANAAGIDSLFVFSGASRLKDVVFAQPAEQPTYAAPDLRGILEPGLNLHDPVDHLVEIGPEGDVLVPAEGDPARLLRSVIAAGWDALDEGRQVRTDPEMWHAIESRLGLLHS